MHFEGMERFPLLILDGAEPLETKKVSLSFLMSFMLVNEPL